MRGNHSRAFAGLALALTATLGGAVLTAPTAAAAPSKAELRKQADRYMNMTYNDYHNARKTGPFNFKNNGCSVPGNSYAPFKVTFTRACNQHDFGYRNYGGNGLKLSKTRSTKNWLDRRFKQEMYRACKNSNWHKKSCETAADAYYLAVNTGGDKAFFG
ncbi:phospholipase A2 [Streptomyces alkaliterrae]|uniref:Phospholipase n=1 Tax=Streptomyces alkaliterrae TaxID=2213162 RepID=A0A5P0YRT5_9ACTN|nr:phospholipase A2 [Streptomyces alkaliterrae]MBB1255005.1 hypothetical protein [Streptomyces alkaliterrae]MBB1261700.1 hypothetical protein [Streptomyces alkaliterrae]MQS03041.1 hypothetical protein [Streptomyces alkaliterrae]